MTTFSTLSTALSSMVAQRAALDVAGQNVANANTVGYTRQRADISSVSTVANASRFSSGLTVGQGVKVDNVLRLGDIFADTRVRTTTSSAAFLATRAEAFARLESTIDEPSDSGVAAQLADFWAAWQDVANNPGEPAPGRVLLEAGRAATTAIAAGYTAVDTQWSDARTQTEAYVAQTNTTAQSVAELNETIRSVLVSNGNANELIDKRDALATELAELVGGSVRQQSDGTVTVNVGGNPIVSGSKSYGIHLAGSTTMSGAQTDPPRIVWDRTTAGTVTLDGGVLAGMVSVLAPAELTSSGTNPYASTGNGGLLAEAAASYNRLAHDLASSVNGIHTTGRTTAGAAGGEFFALPGNQPAALGIQVQLTDPAQIAAAADGMGGLDGTVADQMSKLGTSATGPDATWAGFVVDLGVRTKSATLSATVSEQARATASSLQLSGASVDIDEETVNMLAYQRAYQGAARVLTAVDEMLDTLINRTGRVGL
ncbi:flagellar hook-associated protein FlgK [Flavimobilis marinus]|uniref:Flagellar hook-associated protein 1 n=1 Tax=Flavimobilis marinus TaxID=285351 RepID=A0A1I2GPG6_9MICO|nr:flagellar hook-associated protein FlgK [Flavimobilis marinus]GHG55741.1 flagellar hook-associated protein FlgK [Flavimobilis marinus]SFF19485.1 flagellar hook-associated protein 1 FlgK [Flavimobilis marinus]